MQREKEKLLLEVSKLTDRLNNAIEYQEQLEKNQSDADLKINDLSGQLDDKNAEVERHKRLRDKLENDVGEMKGDIAKKDTEIASLTETISNNTRFTNKLEEQLKSAKLESSKSLKELELLHVKFSKMLDDYETMNYKFESHKKDYNKLANELKVNDFSTRCFIYLLLLFC